MHHSDLKKKMSHELEERDKELRILSSKECKARQCIERLKLQVENLTKAGTPPQSQAEDPIGDRVMRC